MNENADDQEEDRDENAEEESAATSNDEREVDEEEEPKEDEDEQPDGDERSEDDEKEAEKDQHEGLETDDSAEGDADDEAAAAEEARERRRRAKRRKRKRALAAASESERASRGSGREADRATPGDAKARSYTPLLYAAGALIIGGVGGWFLHDAHAAAEAGADGDPATVASSTGSAGPCQAWQDQICKGAGPRSPACMRARGAADLLPGEACGAALAGVPKALAKIKSARAVCDKLVTKLCDDLGKDTQVCERVQREAESLPVVRCKLMMENYDKVLEGMRKAQQQGGVRPPPGGPGASPGGPATPGHTPPDHPGPPPGAPP